eukprot:g6231.t1
MAASMFDKRCMEVESSEHSWMKKIYGTDWDNMTLISPQPLNYGPDNSHNNNDDELFPIKASLSKEEGNKYVLINAFDSNRRTIDDVDLVSWNLAINNSQEETTDNDEINLNGNLHDYKQVDADLMKLRNNFVPKNWISCGRKSEEHGSNEVVTEIGDTDEVSNDEGGEIGIQIERRRGKEEEVVKVKINTKVSSVIRNNEVGNKNDFVDDDISDELHTTEETVEEVEETRATDALTKKKLDLQERSQLEFGDSGEDMRFRYEGFRQGIYVRIFICRIPAEFVLGFRIKFPLILGGLSQMEESMGFITARIKRHRWYKRILKSRDPLIFSVGWRRFQSIPTYATEDSNDRRRYLKYTPEYMHALCTFYGPRVPPNTNILAFQRDSNPVNNFRICLTGTVLETSHSHNIVKKLKLTGVPVKVHRKTAFVSGMFNSDLELTKFIGASIKTVSGIRGQIKKSSREYHDGTFRATFEDKIQLSDIVSCRLWIPVKLQQYYNPVTSLLRGTAGNITWSGMRTVSDIRTQEGMSISVDKDSLYRPIERNEVMFKKQDIPLRLQENLPFTSKPKQAILKLNASGNYQARRAAIMNTLEKKKKAFLQMTATIGSSRNIERKAIQMFRIQAKAKKSRVEAKKFTDFHKVEKKRKYANKISGETPKSKQAK